MFAGNTSACWRERSKSVQRAGAELPDCARIEAYISDTCTKTWGGHNAFCADSVFCFAAMVGLAFDAERAIEFDGSNDCINLTGLPDLGINSVRTGSLGQPHFLRTRWRCVPCYLCRWREHAVLRELPSEVAEHEQQL